MKKKKLNYCISGQTIKYIKKIRHNDEILSNNISKELDKNRVMRILSLLYLIWHKYPDKRFGQLLQEIIMDKIDQNNDDWLVNMDDKEFENWLDDYLKNYS